MPNPSTRTPEGSWGRCPVCGNAVVIEPSAPPGDAPCPNCGCLLWFLPGRSTASSSSFLKLSFAGENIRTKPRAIASIVDRLVESGAIDHAFREEIVAAIMRREETWAPPESAVGPRFHMPNFLGSST